MRLHEQIIVGLVQLVLPILVVPHLASGFEVQMGLLTAIYVAEFILWELHNKAVNQAYNQGHSDGADDARSAFTPAPMPVPGPSQVPHVGPGGIINSPNSSLP